MSWSSWHWNCIKKAHASSGISPREDKNEWMAEKIDSIIEEDSYALEDILNEDKNEQEVLQYVEEQYRENLQKK